MSTIKERDQAAIWNIRTPGIIILSRIRRIGSFWIKMSVCLLRGSKLDVGYHPAFFSNDATVSAHSIVTDAQIDVYP